MPAELCVRHLRLPHVRRHLQWALTTALALLLLPAVAHAHQNPPAVVPAFEFAPAVAPVVSTAEDDFSDTDFDRADQPEFGELRGGVTFILELIAGFAFGFIIFFMMGLVLGALYLLYLLLRYAAEWVVDRFRSTPATPDNFPQSTE